MGDGFFFWYREDWKAGDADRIIRYLDSRGLMIRNPDTGKISLITNGPESWGEQVFVTEDALLKSATELSGGELNFQLWIAGDLDVFTRIRRASANLIVLEFDINALDSDDLESAISAFISRAVMDEVTIGFVADRSGGSEETDWDSTMAGASVPLESLPDILGIRERNLDRHPELSRFTYERARRICVFDFAAQ
jgi:hypothetical protein